MGKVGRPLSESLGLVLASPNSLLVREVSCAWGMKEKAAQGGCGETGKYEAPTGLLQMSSEHEFSLQVMPTPGARPNTLEINLSQLFWRGHL